MILAGFQKFLEITKNLISIHRKSLYKSSFVSGFPLSILSKINIRSFVYCVESLISNKVFQWMLPQFTSTKYIVLMFIDFFFM